jgi:hypothetical protein
MWQARGVLSYLPSRLRCDAHLSALGDRLFSGSLVADKHIWASGGRELLMFRDKRVHFECPNCRALYQVIEVEARPDTPIREVTCLSCGGPLPARQRNLVLKYFLLRTAGRPQNGQRYKNVVAINRS